MPHTATPIDFCIGLILKWFTGQPQTFRRSPSTGRSEHWPAFVVETYRGWRTRNWLELTSCVQALVRSEPCRRTKQPANRQFDDHTPGNSTWCRGSRLVPVSRLKIAHSRQADSRLVGGICQRELFPQRWMKIPRPRHQPLQLPAMLVAPDSSIPFLFIRQLLSGINGLLGKSFFRTLYLCLNHSPKAVFDQSQRAG